MPVRISALSKLLFLFLLLSVRVSAQSPTNNEAARLLPERIGDFRAQGAPYLTRFGIFEMFRAEDFAVVADAQRKYVSPKGELFVVHLAKMRTDSAAYSLLTLAGSTYVSPASVRSLTGVGTAGLSAPGHIAFFKGTAFATVVASGKQPESSAAALNDLARLLAETLDAGAGSVPVLVQHLPDWEKVQEQTGYAVSLPALQTAAGQKPALEVVSFDGGAEAVTATYGSSRLVIVEFTTPQYSVDNDALIKERIAQLQTEGKPVPTAYKREGNYSVFVFDAPDEAVAAQLLNSVKYEKDVRWLGDNPHALEHAQKAYYEMTGSTLLNTLILTGFSILLCLGVGGLFGGAVFLYRRSQSAATQVYSDAGGMVRLNIDEITPETDPGRLLGRGKP